MKKFQKISDSDEILAASDAFFPFVDGIEKLYKQEFQQSFNRRVQKMIKKLLNLQIKTNTILVFSKTRHFNH